MHKGLGEQIAAGAQGRRAQARERAPRTCVSVVDVSKVCRIEMENTAVLPVPDWD